MGKIERLRDPVTNYVICCGFPKSSTLFDRVYNSDRAKMQENMQKKKDWCVTSQVLKKYASKIGENTHRMFSIK